MKLDEIDKAILNYLQGNAKMTNKELSNHLNLSVTAVYERIKKLEKNGIIESYAAILNRKALDKELLVISQIKITRHTQQEIADFEEHIANLKEVHECLHVSGDYDYILKMTFANMDSYREFMVNKLTAIPGIGSSHSIFVINEVKKDSGFLL